MTKFVRARCSVLFFAAWERRWMAKFEWMSTLVLSVVWKQRDDGRVVRFGRSSSCKQRSESTAGWKSLYGRCPSIMSRKRVLTQKQQANGWQIPCGLEYSGGMSSVRNLIWMWSSNRWHSSFVSRIQWDGMLIVLRFVFQIECAGIASWEAGVAFEVVGKVAKYSDQKIAKWSEN